MNLLQDKWITIQRRNGKIEKIAPYQITDGIITGNPIVEIVTPRPDFKGALYQFLIGLFQTVYAPQNENEWEDRFNEPPSPDELKKETDKVAFAFDLFGESIRFMQDVTLGQDDTRSNIASLFIESPGENTLKENKDHFIKRGSIEKICPTCAAISLFTLQTNSPSGGQGHLTSIRGGGPLTTILKYDTKEKENLKYITLWSDIWLNTIPKDSFHSEKEIGKKFEFVFPWVTDQFYKNSSKGNKTTNQDLHPFAVYWSYPRRVLLNLTKEIGICDICQEDSTLNCKSYSMRTYGLDYGSGGWIHPLSPYYFKKDKELGETWFPYHPQPGGIIYNHWQAFIYGSKGRDKNAKVLNYFHELGRKEGQAIVWVFGYDMDNMKARCWYESLIPIHRIESKELEIYEPIISSILQVATQIANNLQTKVKDAWFNEGAKPRGDFDYLKLNFYKATESKFYELAKQIRDNIDKSNPFDDQAKLDWLKYLNEESLKIFDLYVESGSTEFENIQRIVSARNSLISWNLGSKIKAAIGLSVLPIGKKKTVIVAKKKSTR